LNQKAIDRAGDDNIDIIDEHAYKGPDWIRSNFDYFDKYPRKPWKVYVGEYASHSSNGNLLAALGDSVYLMMMERNGDMVTMASYAPLFCNVNQKSWGVNLIEFDSSRSFAHASYYVQKAFNENRPDVNLAVTTGVYPPDPEKPSFFTSAGYGRQGKSQYVVLKATNYYPHAVTVNVKLDGAKWISKTGRHIVIKSEKLLDQNTLDNPYKIVPVEKPLINCSKDFTVTLEPYSVNILRVPVIK
jgi:alpha-N-arabinofuranosidase